MTAIDARTTAQLLGGDVSGPGRVLCPGPGHGPGDRSLSVRLEAGAPDGFLVHSFAGDDWTLCRDHVRDLLRLGPWLPAAPDLPRPKARPAPAGDEAGRIAAALRIWAEALPIVGTLAERYLTGRELALDGAADLRFHPSCPFGNGVRLPCMIALFRDLRSDKPVAIQRTALTPDAAKIDRKMLGPVAGAAVQLDPGEGVTYGLAIAEGVESALAARTSFRPCWALGSAGAIAAFPVLGGVESLTIYADADPTGQAAARACADRWAAAGAEVHVRTPSTGDANDLIRKAAP